MLLELFEPALSDVLVSEPVIGQEQPLFLESTDLLLQEVLPSVWQLHPTKYSIECLSTLEQLK